MGKEGDKGNMEQVYDDVCFENSHEAKKKKTPNKSSSYKHSEEMLREGSMQVEWYWKRG